MERGEDWRAKRNTYRQRVRYMATASSGGSSPATARRSSLRILVADSNELIRCGIRSVLEDQPGWKVCGEAATGLETIEKTKAQRPDLVLLGVTLPDMEAEKVIPLIAAVSPTPKIVALAVHEFAESAANALAAGASGLVLKSEPANIVVQAVRNVGRGQPFLSPAAVSIIGSQLRGKLSGTTRHALSRREVEVLKALAQGESNKQTASSLGISEKTVAAHRARVMRKLKVTSYRDLVRFAIRHGMIKPPES